MKKLILTYCLLIIAYSLLPTADCFADQNKIDSLKNILKTASIKQKPAILNELADALFDSSLEGLQT